MSACRLPPTTMTSSPDPLAVLQLGDGQPYDRVRALQKELHAKLLDGSQISHLITCCHAPVITIGKSGKVNNVLASLPDLEARGVQVLHVERGGDVTWHGPGQLVVYPILDLTKKRRDVGWYMRSLEEVVMRTLLAFGVQGIRIAGRTGVWVARPEGEPRKISSMGVKLSRWCTYHGISLNVTASSHEGFALIHPCGFADVEVTSIEEETGGQVEINAVEQALVAHFAELFVYEIRR
jgi:lipoyl(octanoyl) transferase